jgi:hypothetical protein
MELIEDQVYAMAANGVRWGTRSALTAIVSHFPELELLRCCCNMDLIEDQVDAGWTRTRHDSESLASFIPPSVAHGSLDDMGDEQ